MTGFSPREERLAALQSREFDVLVVGGGITGAAVARDAASRGLSVALVERGDWGSGTSWRSTKLVHGGLRYLKQARLSLVFESLAERARLLANAPHLVRPLEFLFAVLPGGWVSPAALSAGLTLYDLLALGRGAPFHRRLSAAGTLREEPLLEGASPTGGALYFDASTDDARLTLENVLDAAALGAVTVSRVESLAALRDGAGRVAGSAVKDVEGGRELEVRATVTVDATGPWSDERRAFREPGASTKRRLRLSRGAHVTVPAAALPVRRAVAIPAEPGRLFFAIPSGAVTLLGTTESDFAGPADEVAPTAGDVASILARAAEAFPGAAPSASDAVAAFAGLRPLRVERGRGASETSREEAIESGPGWVSVIGGKLTTHRRMGAHVVDRALRGLGPAGRRAGESRTASRPFPGAVRGQGSAAEVPGIPPALAAHLNARYGSRASEVAAIVARDPSSAAPLVEGFLDCEAEVRHAARLEDARSAADVLVRRTHLFWRARGNGAGAAERVHAILSEELGRDSARDARSAAELSREIERSRSALEGASGAGAPPALLRT